ncbi:putative nuclease HARBI1 isoform X2 [Ixodes scapularis]
MFSAARRRRLVNSTFSLIELFFSPERLYREHRDAFELPEEIFRKQYRLPKIVVRWLCDELREEPEVRRVRTSWTVMTVELQVLCALRFYGTGSFQGMVASDEHVARDQKTVSVAVRAVSVAIVRRLGVQRGWIHFPETPSERFDAEKGFRLLGRIPGVIGCVDGTMVSIVGPSKNDPTVTKAAYWCRKYFYALNVMVVCDADCRIMCIDPRYPGSVHDSFVWQFSWLRNQLEQGQLPRDGRFLLAKHADFFDACVMEQLRHQLTEMTPPESSSDAHCQDGTSVTFHGTVVARRKGNEGKVNLLMHWEPEHVLPDSWVPESSHASEKVVALSSLSTEALRSLNLWPRSVPCQTSSRRRKRK